MRRGAHRERRRRSLPRVGRRRPLSRRLRTLCAARTDGSSRNAVKMPMAFEPPPTQAATASGSRPVRSSTLAGLVADDSLEVADHDRERVRAADRSQQVVGALDVGDPVAHGLVDGVLERAASGADRHDLGAQQAHPGHVERLPPGVLLAHVDDALQVEQRAGGRGGDTVLTCPGLRDDATLPHAPGQQRLAEHVVDLVRAGVVEVLALEQHGRACPAASAANRRASVSGLGRPV